MHLYSGFSIWRCSKSLYNDHFTPSGPEAHIQSGPMYAGAHTRIAFKFQCCLQFWNTQRSDVQWPDDRQVSTASGISWQTRTAIDLPFSCGLSLRETTCPIIFVVSTQWRLSGPNWHTKSTLRPPISRSHYYYDWDDCWPPVPYIPYVSLLHKTDLR